MNQQQRFPNAGFNQPQNMQPFQPNTNFRGRGPRHRYPKYCGARPSLSRNEEHWCETCDRGFRTLDMLESHKQQHQVCKIDGCQYIAHPNQITKHIQMQHSSGLFKKIANLTNPKDIQKWREERKKRYPTKENVAMKAAQLNEKIERGEKMGLKREKIKNDGAHKRKHSHSYENVNDKSRKSGGNTKSKKNKYLKKQEMLPLSENMRKLKPFAGILDLAIEYDIVTKEEDQHCNYEIEDDEDCVPGIKMVNTTSTNEELLVCGALSSLMCEYGSTDEEVDTIVNESQSFSNINCNNFKDDNNKDSQTKNSPMLQNLHNKDCEESIVNKKNTRLTNSKSISIEQKYRSDDDCPPEEVKVERALEIKTDTEEELKRKSAKTKNHKNFNVKRPIKKPNLKLPSTLLQKLLHREIQQERNIVLQCIRHIVKNYYFDKMID